MAERYLIDSSGVIKYLNKTFPVDGINFLNTILEQESVISFITEIELQSWEPPDRDDMEVYRLFVSKSIVLGIKQEIVNETIRICRSYKIKLPDALIAATAIINEMVLVADNDKDFLRVHELKYLNPQQLRNK